MFGRFLRKRAASRFVFLGFSLLALAAWLTPLPAAARIARTDSSIVIDADTGQVVSEHNADARAYPASLTKMMTLYLLFEALEEGRISLDQRLPVSRHAANQAPSKLGLHAGQTIAVRDVILGLITRSANDAAVVAAEALGGSEPGFAAMMTQKAQALGMTSTTYRNASGLPNPGQITTARDLARLARALYHDFPKEYAYFATAEFTYHGATYVNHNHLMEAFEGMDGIKTGYIRASGFNLAASAVRNNHRLIGVVMGGQSAYARDLEMAELLNEGFGEVNHTALASAQSDDDSSAGIASGAERTIAALSPVGRAEAAPSLPRRVSARLRNGGGGWSIQVGAFAQEAAAEKAATVALSRIRAYRHKAVQVLAPGSTDKEPVYRARIVSFSEREAEKACRKLHRRHMQCAVVGPSATQQAAAN